MDIPLIVNRGYGSNLLCPFFKNELCRHKNEVSKKAQKIKMKKGHKTITHIKFLNLQIIKSAN